MRRIATRMSCERSGEAVSAAICSAVMVTMVAKWTIAMTQAMSEVTEGACTQVSSIASTSSVMEICLGAWSAK